MKTKSFQIFEVRIFIRSCTQTTILFPGTTVSRQLL